MVNMSVDIEAYHVLFRYGTLVKLFRCNVNTVQLTATLDKLRKQAKTCN